MDVARSLRNLPTIIGYAAEKCKEGESFFLDDRGRRGEVFSVGLLGWREVADSAAQGADAVAGFFDEMDLAAEVHAGGELAVGVDDDLQRGVVVEHTGKEAVAVGIEQFRVEDEQIHRCRVANTVKGLDAVANGDHRMTFFLQLALEQVAYMMVDVGYHDVHRKMAGHARWLLWMDVLLCQVACHGVKRFDTGA